MNLASPEVLQSTIETVLSQHFGVSQNETKKFSSVFELIQFLWKVADKIFETTKKTDLTLQQKEDYVVSIAESVIDYTESKNFLTMEVGEKARKIVKTMDVFADMAIGVYSIFSSPSNSSEKKNLMASFCSLISCVSKKAVTTDIEIKPSTKVEVLPEPQIEDKPVVNQATEPVIEGKLMSEESSSNLESSTDDSVKEPEEENLKK